MAEVVGIVASLAGLAVQLGKCMVQPIKRQLNYLCCFTSNIQSLRNEAKKLDDAKDGLQLRVNAAEDNVEVILPEVVSWLKSSNEIKVDINGIEGEIPNVKWGFMNVKSRFLLSKKAKKTTEVMKELRGDCKFDPISQHGPPPARGPIPIGETYEFETRKQIEEDIMKALKDGEVNMLGLCGMGGVGKTTMAKKIMNRARNEDLFDEILMVVVSQPVKISKIQIGISESLGLKLEVESLPARAHKLRARLMGTKRTLVVLDDVWERLIMEDLGIPCESGIKGCTVLLTSRDRDVFNAMNIQKVCALQILPQNESWFLFKNKVGTCMDEVNLVSIAEEVARECKGLPIALVTVGRALKGKKSKFIWEDALQQLKGSKAVDIPHVLAEVYNPLKLSYDFLDNRHARSVFLFCSLFPEDADISLEHLTWYFLGLGMFEGIRHLEETRNKVYTLVELLKSRFLLLDGYDEHTVKMHDVVRDVAIFVASQEGRVGPNCSSTDWSLEQFYSDCTWISMFPQERVELPIVLNAPSLRLLLIDNSKESGTQMHDQFFEAIKDLNVLSFRYISFKSLPQTIQLLENLLTLHLEFCTLESISIVGELSSLEILSFRSCHSIRELPAEIGKLTRLKLLEFSNCISLERVVPGVISRFVQLEELKMIGSFKGWEAEKNRKERRNASLNELQSLSNLRCLEIEIEDFTLASEEIRLSPKIVKYDIRFIRSYSGQPFEKRMYLKCPREISLGNWIHIFLRNTEYLKLEGDGSNSLNRTQVQNTKAFDFSECSTVKKLVSTTSIDWRFGVFPVLEFLKLKDLPNFEEICNGPIESGSNSFNNLKELEISDLPALMYLWNSENQNVSLSNLTSIYIQRCDKLRNLFPLKTAKDGLSQLKELKIWSCEMMEEVFSNDGGGHITFRKLKILRLGSLPSLTTFCKGIESIEFPLLTELRIGHCQKLTSFVSSTGNNPSLAGHSDDSLHWFCNQEVTFGSLKDLRMGGCQNISNLWCHQIPPGFFSKLETFEIRSFANIRSLFSSSIVANLVNLNHLYISSCSEMVKVIGDHPQNACENSPFFPSLETITIDSLSNLVNFCGWRCALQLPSLWRVLIFDCPRMESFTMGPLITPNLNSIDSQNEGYIWQLEETMYRRI